MRSARWVVTAVAALGCGSVAAVGCGSGSSSEESSASSGAGQQKTLTYGLL
ncbi:MAG: hypothetical protein JWR30_652, partial [Conexibacter sp.]|nr:hypothetical protein [Conexibacter sp.]